MVKTGRVWHRSRCCHSDEPARKEIENCRRQRAYWHPRKGNKTMNEKFDSAAEKFSPGNHPGDQHQNEAGSATSTWNENLKDNLFIVLLVAVAISFLAG